MSYLNHTYWYNEVTWTMLLLYDIITYFSVIAITQGNLLSCKMCTIKAQSFIVEKKEKAFHTSFKKFFFLNKMYWTQTSNTKIPVTDNHKSKSYFSFCYSFSHPLNEYKAVQCGGLLNIKAYNKNVQQSNRLTEGMWESRRLLAL